MIRAKLKMNTEHIVANKECYCAYCGKKIEPDTEIDHHKETHYYHCDCEDAKKEIFIMQEKERITNKFKKDMMELDNQWPEKKYDVEKREVLVEI